MLINRVSKQLFAAPELALVLRQLRAGSDTTLQVARSARPLLVAALWAIDPRPCLFVVSGEEVAARAARAIAGWLGQEWVARYPDRRDLPWSDRMPDDAAIGARISAVARLAAGKKLVVVTSARALLRRVPPVGSDYYMGADFAVGEQVDFSNVGRRLVEMGYTDAGEASQVDVPGLYHVHGDAVDLFPAQAISPVRIEFFGDEIDRIRRMVPSTGQTIGELSMVSVMPCREMAFTDKTVERANRALYNRAQNSTKIAADLELILRRAADPKLERYLPELYGTTASPLQHMSKKTLMILAEPRALFDDCVRAFDEISTVAHTARIQIEGLYTTPRALDFGKQQRLSLVSMLRTGSSTVSAELKVLQPGISGPDAKLLGRTRQMVNDRMTVLFAVPARSVRETLEATFTDEAIPFCESLGSAPENRAPITAPAPHEHSAALARGMVTFTDSPIPAGVVIPAANLAVLSVSDLTARMSKNHRRTRRLDPTKVTFPFKPGEYVVHATHGIAFFADIVRQEVDGRERDYFLLEYAHGDKLYVPLEQIDRITRYVGPDGSAPRLTRLNTADWSRATGKARRSAKKLAFDLVDLYTRRSTVIGHAFSPDTPAQEDMEASFPFELTPDQQSALFDIKADMELPRPMDRLLCGDVGFGKTEVALRAAFKCCQDKRQVMVLCPTTILAQQHFETFFARFSPFDLSVRVLSRFVSPAQQRKTLEGFADGSVHVLIGTHRLLSGDVNPHDLGLVIIDEEQRFGVQHKEQLKNLREQVDVLALSATPIPRTLQMAISGVRDMSLILTPPPGRVPVKVQVGEYDPDVVSAAIRTEIARKGQVYYVSNRVHTIGDAVERVKEAAPEARVRWAHGKMSARQIEDVMMEFEAHDIDVLVTTTIIENGIDNPHTNTLIIEDSQRLGLAQLYQLKGRVGRGRKQAYAYFMFPPEQPLTPEATDRLTAINEYQDLGSGMHIAMRDLEIRGAGSLMGAEQHGNLSSVGFDLFTQMLSQAVAEARGEIDEAGEGDISRVEDLAGADLSKAASAAKKSAVHGISTTGTGRAGLAQTEVMINLPAEFYIAEEYMPNVDSRVLAYRRLASAIELAEIDDLQAELEERFSTLPQAARNLFDRARIRIRANRLGLTSVSLSAGRLVFMGIKLSRNVALVFKEHRALYYPKTGKLAYPFHLDIEHLMSTALGVLEQVGGDDECA